MHLLTSAAGQQISPANQALLFQNQLAQIQNSQAGQGQTNGQVVSENTLWYFKESYEVIFCFHVGRK